MEMGTGGGRSEPQTVARDAIVGCIVVGTGVGPGGEVRGRVIIEQHHIPVNDEWDADDGVGVIAVDKVLGLGQPERKMTQGCKHLSGRGMGSA